MPTLFVFAVARDVSTAELAAAARPPPPSVAANTKVCSVDHRRPRVCGKPGPSYTAGQNTTQPAAMDESTGKSSAPAGVTSGARRSRNTLPPLAEHQRIAVQWQLTTRRHRHWRGRTGFRCSGSASRCHLKRGRVCREDYSRKESNGSSLGEGPPADTLASDDHALRNRKLRTSVGTPFKNCK